MAVRWAIDCRVVGRCHGIAVRGFGVYLTSRGGAVFLLPKTFRQPPLACIIVHRVLSMRERSSSSRGAIEQSVPVRLPRSLRFVATARAPSTIRQFLAS